VSVADELRALRGAVALADGDQLACVRVRGAGAHDLLDRVSPRELFVRSGQLIHTLFLDDAAQPIADVYLGCDEDDYLVIAEGMSGPAVRDYLAAHAGGLDAQLDDTSASHAFLCLGGPYAWELLGELTSPDVIGLPYLGFFHERRFTCFRAGKHGEFGYDLLVPREDVAEVRARIHELGRAFDLRAIGPEGLAVAMLENWFWNPRRDVAPGLTPIELQLQWRTSRGRAFPGSAALDARRGAATQRAVMATAASALAAGAPIAAGDRVIGSVLHAEYSPLREEWIAMALLERPLAHAGLTGLACHGAAVATRSAPALNNLSLYVDPQRHSYATRANDRFPPLVQRA
jgi:glycine cleavage system T protein (aminomethyltransferase)